MSVFAGDDSALVARRVRDEALLAAAHDLKTPLAAVKVYAAFLRRGALREGLAEQDQRVQGLARIEASSNRMAKIVDELLDLARLGAGHSVALDPAPTDLVELVHDLVTRTQEVSPLHSLRVDVGAARLVGDWDATRVERVVENLLGNALKYSPAGGEIVLGLRRDADGSGAWAVLEVSDPGVGIPSADLPHVFEWFRRGGNVRGKITGNGIGLASARRIVEQHGGSITAASRLGAGTRITVRLPLVRLDRDRPATRELAGSGASTAAP